MPTLKISKEVNANTEDAETVVPASGKTLVITRFVGAGAFSQNAVIKLIWDYSGTQDVIWTIKGTSRMPFQHTIPAADTDGIKKLAVALDNSHSGKLFMSGYVEYSEV